MHIEDVKINAKVWYKMEEERNSWDWEESIELEYSMAQIQSQQEWNGVLFNKEEAVVLYTHIEGEMQTIGEEVIPNIPKRCNCLESGAGYVYGGQFFKTQKVAEAMGIPKEKLIKEYNYIKKPFKKDGSYTKAVEDFFANS
jgi:hypothetical protein